VSRIVTSHRNDPSRTAASILVRRDQQVDPPTITFSSSC